MPERRSKPLKLMRSFTTNSVDWRARDVRSCPLREGKKWTEESNWIALKGRMRAAV